METQVFSPLLPRRWRTPPWDGVPQPVASRRIGGVVDQLKVSVGVPGVAGVQATLRDDRQASLPAGERELEHVIRETCTPAHEEKLRGLVIFIDEIQAADRSGLRTLAYAWQHLRAEAQDVPAAVFAAGLPESPEVIGEAATFSERFRYRPLQRLSREASLSALVTPASGLGVGWEATTLERVVDRAEGYPYSLQLYGEAVWVAAGNPDAGAQLGDSHLDLASARSTSTSSACSGHAGPSPPHSSAP